MKGGCPGGVWGYGWASQAGCGGTDGLPRWDVGVGMGCAPRAGPLHPSPCQPELERWCCRKGTELTSELAFVIHGQLQGITCLQIINKI